MAEIYFNVLNHLVLSHVEKIIPESYRVKTKPRGESKGLTAHAL